MVPLVLSPAPCVYRAAAVAALDGAGIGWTETFVSPSFTGCAAAVQAGLGLAVMPRGLVPPGLTTPDGWPPLPDAEIALLAAPQGGAPVRALADFIAERVWRRG
jgi:DNA-binding transcriptional LysR family regulator